MNCVMGIAPVGKCPRCEAGLHQDQEEIINCKRCGWSIRKTDWDKIWNDFYELLRATKNRPTVKQTRNLLSRLLEAGIKKGE